MEFLNSNAGRFRELCNFLCQRQRGERKTFTIKLLPLATSKEKKLRTIKKNINNTMTEDISNIGHFLVLGMDRNGELLSEVITKGMRYPPN